MKIQFEPKVNLGNIGSACVALLVAGGVLVRIGSLERNQEAATAERTELRASQERTSGELRKEVAELDKKMVRVLTLLEERTRPRGASGESGDE